MSNNVLEIKNVTKYFGKTKIIDNISINVQEGEIYGFLGPNGAGKTTTIKMILGLLSIDEGNIIINGYDITKSFEKAMESIGGIVENPDMYDYMTGRENLQLYARMRNVKKERIDEVIKLVDMEKAADQKVKKYSLGMKQRMGLALTLLHSPKVLILDEPTNGLDPVGIKSLRDILKRIAKEEKTAVFVSSHIIAEMQAMCDKIAMIKNGKIIKISDIDTLLKHQENEKVECIVKVKQLEEAFNLIKEQLTDEIKQENNQIIVNVYKEDISKITKLLVSNDIDVESITEKAVTLEDIFFDTTGDKNK
jgi:ABC-2 type transport system ATP-binding protein